MTGAKICLVLATGIAANEVIPGDAGVMLTALAKGGIVAVLLVAIVCIYRDGKARQDKLEKIIEANAEASTKLADSSKTLAGAVYQQNQVTREVILKCHRDGPAPVLPEVKPG